MAFWLSDGGFNWVTATITTTTAAATATICLLVLPTTYGMAKGIYNINTTFTAMLFDLGERGR